jgi:hypothetical protein
MEMVRQVGFEPTTFSLEVRCTGPLCDCRVGKGAGSKLEPAIETWVGLQGRVNEIFVGTKK